MPIISEIAQQKKVNFFFKSVYKKAKILEVGCGNYWLGNYLKMKGWKNYTGLDLSPPADIVGNIKNWEKLKIKPNSFDVVVAFEVVEHVNCFKEMWELLKPGGLLFLTSPLPQLDWMCKILETVGLTQKRTSPHNNLINFQRVPFFKPIKIKKVGGLAQWGIFNKITNETKLN